MRRRFSLPDGKILRRPAFRRFQDSLPTKEREIALKSPSRIHYNAPVILTLFLLSLAALVLGALTHGWTTRHLFSVYRSSPMSPLFYVRLLGHVLGHSGYEHFAGNMVLLLVVGPPMEEKYGSRVLLIGIALTAVISGLLQCLLFPGVALLGASLHLRLY